jgi:hypothetical protein
VPKAERPADEVGPAYWIYRDDRTLEFHPTVMMPDGKGVAQDPASADRPYKGKSCIKASYLLDSNPFVGVAFVLDGAPEKPMRKFDVYRKLSCARGTPIVLRFYARSDQKVRAKFKFGGFPKDSERFGVEESFALDPQWKRYEIDLSEADLSAVHAAFTWSMDRGNASSDDDPDRKEAVMFLDDIYITQVKARPRKDD